MINRNKVILVLTAALIGSLMYFSFRSNETEKEMNLMSEKMSSQRETITALEDDVASYSQDIQMLKESNQNRLELEEAMNADIENYEHLIDRLTDRLDVHALEVRKRAYEVSAVFRTDDLTFDLPANGQVLVDTNDLELEIHVKHPPQFRSEAIDGRLRIYKNLFQGIEHPIVSESEITDSVYRVKFTNLETDDAFTIRLNYDLDRLLDLDSSSIQVLVTDEFDVLAPAHS